MEREPNDLPEMSPDDINEMERKRLDKLDEAGINENEVLAQAAEHMNIWQSYFGENITRGKDDLNFVITDQ